MKATIVVALTFVVALVASAAPPERKPWQWTLEERIEARTDPAAQRARVAASKSGHASVQSDGFVNEDGIRRDQINGGRHPELFLPYEIYTIYMRAAYAYDDEPALQYRRDIAAKMAEVGLPEEIVTALVAESSVFIQLQTQEEKLRAKMGDASADERGALIDQMAILRLQACPVRAAVLSRMRARFGNETFDRFLYEILARGASMGFAQAPDAQTLLAEEEGCR